MNGYIRRLMLCGCTLEEAREIYSDYINNFTLAELEVYVRYLERIRHVVGVL